MSGLVIIGFFLVYLVVSATITIAVAGWAKRKKRSPWWPVLAGLVMYNLVFWDWLPTVAVHQYYCSTEAGFWVYKTVDQWKTENPGGMEELVANRGEPSARQGDMVNYTDTYFVSQRFNLKVRHNGPFLFNRWRHERELVDTKTHVVLARYVDFSTSQEQRQAGWSGWKFWLDSRNCIDGRDQLINFGKFYLQFKGAEK